MPRICVQCPGDYTITNLMLRLSMKNTFSTLDFYNWLILLPIIVCFDNIIFTFHFVIF